MYQKVDERIIEQLYSIFNKESVIVNDNEALLPFAGDEGCSVACLPEAVVFPEEDSQVSDLLKLCNLEKIPLTPRGGGTGVTGAAIAVLGGIVVSLAKYNKILEIDDKNFCVKLQPGVILANLHAAVEAQGLFYPPDPNSLDSCTLGGNLSTSAGGPRCVKYGITRDYVLQSRFINPLGNSISFGGKFNKISTGYHLTQLMIGAEGTLGVITEMILKLIPKPPVAIDLLVPFAKFKDACDCIPQILKHNYSPAIVEFIDQDAIFYSEQHLAKKFKYSDEAEAQLLIELDGFDQAEVEKKIERLGEYLLQNGAFDVFVAEDRKTKDKIWEMRKTLREALTHIGKKKMGEDVVVPREAIADLLWQVKKLRQKYNLNVVAYGHAGDGNVHVNVVKDDISDDIWEKMLPQCIAEIFDISISLGGTISGEHGIGLTKKEYLPLVLTKNEIGLMRAIKQAFDPNLIMNPGKIFK